MTKRWVVGPGDGECVDDVVVRAGGDARALDDGRVFIGKRRARSGDRVALGDEVVVHDRDDAEAREAPEVAILHHADGLLAVVKPAGISTIPDQHGAEGSLLYRAARAAGAAPDALHPTSRLDRGVSGVVVFAATERARERLRQARNEGSYFRRYVALSDRAPAPPCGMWTAPIGRARDPKKRMARGRDAEPAETRYGTVAVAPHGVLLSVEPVTGRTHQIRVHASDAGAPLLGDKDYGGTRTLVLPSGKVVAIGRIALHCAEVRVLGLVLRAPIPEEMRELWRLLGGRDDDLLL